jgi:hypothetical protein
MAPGVVTIRPGLKFGRVTRSVIESTCSTFSSGRIDRDKDKGPAADFA